MLICIILVPLALREQEKPRPEELGHLVDDVILVSWIFDTFLEPLHHPQSLIDLAKHDGAAIGADSLTATLDVERSVETRLKQRYFVTHGTPLPSYESCLCNYDCKRVEGCFSRLILFFW